MTKKLLLCIAAMFAVNSLMAEVEDNVLYVYSPTTKSFSAGACESCDYSGSLEIKDSIAFNGVKYPVTSIRQSGFNGAGMSSLTLPETVTSIGIDAFKFCTNLMSVSMPGVHNIGSNAFDGCSSLSSITFPSCLETIANAAFNGCSNLTSITCEGTNTIPHCSSAISFNGVSKDIAVEVPYGYLLNYRKDPVWSMFVNLTDGSSVPVSGVSLNNTTLEIFEGVTATLKATIKPEDAANIIGTWSSSDASVATVDANGTVKAVKEGTATITFTTEDGHKTATCTVTVKKDTSSNESIAANKAYIYGNTLYIKTASSKETVCVYSISGQCLDKFVKTTESISVDASVYPTGVLIITSDKGLSLKVMK